MVCKHCGKENQDDMRFCGYCGKNLEGKIKCKNCDEWVDEDFTYCPYCSTQLKDDDIVENDRFVKVNKVQKAKKLTIIFSSVTNSIVILLCLGMFLVLFGSISSFKYKRYGDRNINSKINVIEYIESSFHGLIDYTSDDFEKRYEDSNNPNFDFNKVNSLDFIILDEVDGSYVTQRISMYLSLGIILAMATLPLVLMGLSIYDLAKLQYTNRYKKFMLIELLLGFVLSMLIPLIGHSVGGGTITYIIFACIGLLYSYIIDILAKDRNFDGKALGFKVVTSIMLFILFFASISSVGKHEIGYSNSESVMYSQKINYGDFSAVSSFINKKVSNEYILKNFVNMLSSDKMKEDNLWLLYFSLLVPIFTLATSSLLVTSLFVETKKNINLKYNKPKTTVFIWLAFVFATFTIASTIVVSVAYNKITKDSITYNAVYEFKIAAGYIVFAFFTLALAIYQTITRKFVQE